MNDNARQIKAIVDRGLAPLLKQAGFRKNSTHFSRRNGEALQLINVQSSQCNNASLARFTLNVGVHFASVAEMLYGNDPMPSPPREMFCLLRTRVGMILPAGADHWWIVTPDTNVESVAGELSSAWNDYISQWLEKNKTIAGAAPELEKGMLVHPLATAAARLVLGEREKAAQSVNAVLERFGTALQDSHPANTELIATRIKEFREWAANHRLAEPEEVTQI
jgi:hypothetical protein